MTDAIAVIPARGGSRRIPRKNVSTIAGYPLIAHSILHAKAAKGVGTVYVSTDDEEIASVAREYGADVIMRPAYLADDGASSESALLHVLDERLKRGLPDPELVVFLQCTSPVRKPGDIDSAIAALRAAEADSLFSARRFAWLIWEPTESGLRPLNYDYENRQREQEMSTQYQETGSIYVFEPGCLRTHGNRLGGRVALYEMDYWTGFQLDSPEDAELLEWILRQPDYRPPIRWPERLELIVFDFDGVLTDDSVLVAADGVESVRCTRADSWGIARLCDAGVPMMVLSTEAGEVVAARCKKLGLRCHQGIADKGPALAAHLREMNIAPSSVAYVGNDVNDLGCLELVGLPVVVADAKPEAKRVARLVLQRPGGRGAVREFCDLVLQHLGASP